MYLAACDLVASQQDAIRYMASHLSIDPDLPEPKQKLRVVGGDPAGLFPLSTSPALRGAS